MRSWAIYAFLACFIWGTSPIVAKLLFPTMPPLGVGFYRYLIGAPLLGLFLASTRRNVARDAVRKVALYKYLVLGFLGVPVFTSLFYVGVELTTAGKASLIYSANPIILIFLSSIFLHEKLNMRIVGLATLGFLGVFLVITGGINPAEIVMSGAFMGDMLALGAGMSWAVFSVAGKAWIREIDSYASTAIIVALGSMLMFPIAAAAGGLGFQVAVYELLLMLYLGVFTVALAYLFWIKALASAGVSRLGIFQFVIPAVSVALGAVVLGEAVEVWILLGFILLSASVYLAWKS
ncbi:MAG: DMT family transporter, partial [Candidatus Bathyarchaeia archaeon]